MAELVDLARNQAEAALLGCSALGDHHYARHAHDRHALSAQLVGDAKCVIPSYGDQCVHLLAPKGGQAFVGTAVDFVRVAAAGT